MVLLCSFVLFQSFQRNSTEKNNVFSDFSTKLVTIFRHSSIKKKLADKIRLLIYSTNCYVQTCPLNRTFMKCNDCIKEDKNLLAVGNHPDSALYRFNNLTHATVASLFNKNVHKSHIIFLSIKTLFSSFLSLSSFDQVILFTNQIFIKNHYLMCLR